MIEAISRDRIRIKEPTTPWESWEGNISQIIPIIGRSLQEPWVELVLASRWNDLARSQREKRRKCIENHRWSARMINQLWDSNRIKISSCPTPWRTSSHLRKPSRCRRTTETKETTARFPNTSHKSKRIFKQNTKPLSRCSKWKMRWEPRKSNHFHRCIVLYTLRYLLKPAEVKKLKEGLMAKLRVVEIEY